MKKVTVIGSGNAFNTDGRAHACYLLDNSRGERALLDLGPTSLYRLQSMRVDLNSIDWILLTHFHGDHFTGLPFLLIELDLMLKRQKPLHIFGPAGVQVACEKIVDIAYPGFDFNFDIIFEEIHSETVSMGGFEVSPFPISHRPESLGYRIREVLTETSENLADHLLAPKSFAFSGDSAFDENLWRLVEDVDVAVIELSLDKQSNPPTRHVALDEIIAGRDKITARRVIWSHITDFLAREVTRLELGEAARDGMEILF